MSDDWRLAAACRDTTTSIFFSNNPADIAEAKALCATCSVDDDCLEEALTVPLTGRITGVHGIWAGTNERQRSVQRRQRRQLEEALRDRLERIFAEDVASRTANPPALKIEVLDVPLVS